MLDWEKTSTESGFARFRSGLEAGVDNVTIAVLVRAYTCIAYILLYTSYVHVSMHRLAASQLSASHEKTLVFFRQKITRARSDSPGDAIIIIMYYLVTTIAVLY